MDLRGRGGKNSWFCFLRPWGAFDATSHFWSFLAIYSENLVMISENGRKCMNVDQNKLKSPKVSKMRENKGIRKFL